MAILTAVNRALTAITALPTAAALTDGNFTLLSTQTASSSSTINFTSGLDSTYDSYVFKFINIHAGTDNKDLLAKFRDGSTAYDATCTTTMFSSRHQESGGDYAIGAETGQDEGQSTDGVKLSVGLGTGNDESTSGYLQLFQPSSTTFVKHFMSVFPIVHHVEYSYNWYKTGYVNVTAAVDGVQFVMSSGNIDAGVIKLYGVGPKQS